MNKTTAVISFVGATLILSVLLIGYQSVTSDRPIPDVLQNIAIGSLTLLGGLLVNPSSRHRA